MLEDDVGIPKRGTGMKRWLRVSCASQSYFAEDDNLWVEPHGHT